MTDREKIIKSLKYHLEWEKQPLLKEALLICQECPYRGPNGCVAHLIADTLKLLDAVEPQIISGIPVFNPHTGLEYDTVCKCGNCDMPLIGKANYCFKCGRKVKWE